MSENGAVFENGQMDILNHDCTARPSTSRTKVYAARVEELVDENGQGTTGDLSAGVKVSIEICNTLREGITTLGYKDV
jgi:hypothetical protein